MLVLYIVTITTVTVGYARSIRRQGTRTVPLLVKCRVSTGLTFDCLPPIPRCRHPLALPWSLVRAYSPAPGGRRDGSHVRYLTRTRRRQKKISPRSAKTAAKHVRDRLDPQCRIHSHQRRTAAIVVAISRSTFDPRRCLSTVTKTIAGRTVPPSAERRVERRVERRAMRVPSVPCRVTVD